ncbi:MAG: DUF4870 domain-containing protein [Pseudomonadota bacterium]
MAESKKQPSKTNASQEQTWAMLTHLSAFAEFLFPFGNIIAPLILWLIKRDEFPIVDEHGKEALNFQISVTIYFIVSLVLIILIIGIPMLLAVAIFQFVCIVVAAIKASEGKVYHYPLSIRFIK